MKTKEELNAIKEEVEALSEKIAELSNEGIEQVTGGIELPNQTLSGNPRRPNEAYVGAPPASETAPGMTSTIPDNDGIPPATLTKDIVRLNPHIKNIVK